MLLKSILASTAVTAALFAAAPVFAETIAEKVAANPDLSTLAAALAAADLVGTLEGAGPFPVLAPTNEAFAALPAGLLDELLEPANKEKLTDVLLYHVAPGEYDTGKLKGSEVAISMANGNEMVGIAKDGVTVEDGAIVEAEVRASNGIIHIIDAVLLARDGRRAPPEAEPPAACLQRLDAIGESK